jgi:hypothetical protein
MFFFGGGGVSTSNFGHFLFFYRRTVTSITYNYNVSYCAAKPFKKDVEFLRNCFRLYGLFAVDCGCLRREAVKYSANQGGRKTKMQK